MCNFSVHVYVNSMKIYQNRILTKILSSLLNSTTTCDGGGTPLVVEKSLCFFRNAPTCMVGITRGWNGFFVPVLGEIQEIVSESINWGWVIRNIVKLWMEPWGLREYFLLGPLSLRAIAAGPTVWTCHTWLWFDITGLKGFIPGIRKNLRNAQRRNNSNDNSPNTIDTITIKQIQTMGREQRKIS